MNKGRYPYKGKNTAQIEDIFLCLELKMRERLGCASRSGWSRERGARKSGAPTLIYQVRTGEPREEGDCFDRFERERADHPGRFN